MPTLNLPKVGVRGEVNELEREEADAERQAEVHNARYGCRESDDVVPNIREKPQVLEGHENQYCLYDSDEAPA